MGVWESGDFGNGAVPVGRHFAQTSQLPCSYAQYLLGEYNLMRGDVAEVIRVSQSPQAKKHYPPPAAFRSFIFPPLEKGEIGYRPCIKVTEDPSRSKIALELSEVHEAIHSCQWATNPALHAIHLNGRSSFVLGVRDWVQTTIMTEMEAYAKTTLFAWASKQSSNAVEYNNATEYDPVALADFEDQLAFGRGVQEALIYLIMNGMQKTHHQEYVDSKNVDVSFFEYYAWEALREYSESKRLNFPNIWGVFPYELVLLEDTDYAQMGVGFGPQIMTVLAATLSDVMIFSPEIEHEIRRQELLMGVYNPEKLRTLQQGFDSLGITGEQFIRRSALPYRRDPSKFPYYPDFAAPAA